MIQVNGCTIYDINLSELFCKNGHYKKLNKNQNTITCEQCGTECEWKMCNTCKTDTWTDIQCEYCNHAGCETCLANIWQDCAKCGCCLCKDCYHSCEVTNCPHHGYKYCSDHITLCKEKLCDNYQAYICADCTPIICNHK
jgi:hypothetical protein